MALTGIYGALETHLHLDFWDLIRGLHRQCSLHWLCGGDFNEILKSHEKSGGRLRHYGQIDQFQEVLDGCNLIDLSYLGNKFTWSRSYPNGGMVWERLDRAVGSVDWYDLYPATCVQTLTCLSSNHSPICIRLEGSVVKSSRPWRFEQIWLEDLGCKTQCSGLGREMSGALLWKWCSQNWRLVNRALRIGVGVLFSM